SSHCSGHDRVFESHSAAVVAVDRRDSAVSQRAVQSSTDPDKPLDWFRRPGLQAAVAVAAADKRQFANTEALRQELRRILYRIQHGSGDLRYG
ncbi:hypothetical protein BOX15_Mlig003988g1, partial [Macrostomum lignano]